MFDRYRKLVALCKRIDVVGALYARHDEFCISTDNCRCLAEAAELEEALGE